MFCQKCGRELGENEKFCGGCGSPVKVQSAETEIIAEPTPKPQEKKRRRKSIVPIIIGVILLAAIIATVALMRFDFGETDSVTAMLETAQKYLVELNYEQAIAEFNKVIEVDPINVDAYLGLAEAYERSGDTEKAIEVLEKGLELTGDERIAARVATTTEAEVTVETEEITETSVTVHLTTETTAVAKWSETAMSATMYVTENCYSGANAIGNSIPVSQYFVGDSVTVVAITDTEYYKLDTGAFIHSDYLSDTPPVTTNAAVSNETIFLAKLDELVEEYGIFENYQSTTMEAMSGPKSWLNVGGIVSADIRDFDYDGELEMLVCICEYYGEDRAAFDIYDAYYQDVLYMWEIEDGAAVQRSSIPVVPYYREDDFATICSYSSENKIRAVSIAENDGGCYLLCECKSIGGFFGDGSDRGYWILEYKNDRFQYVCAYVQKGPGSAGFEFVGYEFENGDCIGSNLYYSEWYETSETALYDNYGEAITAFFAQYNIAIDDSVRQLYTVYDDYNSFSSIFSDNGIDLLHCFLINGQTNEDYTEYYFTATLNRGNDLLHN